MMELKRKATVPQREMMTKDSIIHMKRMKAETVVGVGLLSTEQVVVSWSNRMFGGEVMG
jgi:serine protease inhibitor ecotin